MPEDQMPKSEALDAALREAKPVLKRYVAKLEATNAELQMQIGQLEANNVSAQNRIVALQKHPKKGKHAAKPDVDEYARRLKAGRELAFKNPKP